MYKLYSFINIAGLAVGIASFILIMIYANNERSYNRNYYEMNKIK